MNTLRRIAVALNLVENPLPANSDGECGWCREFILPGDGIIHGRSIYCSEYCLDQNEAMRQGW